MRLKKSKKINKKIFIIGKGSIGLRHSRILKLIGYDVIFIRRKIEDSYNEIEISQIKKNNVLFFIICNPTSLHINAIQKLIKFNKPILVEKPLFDKPNLSFIKKVKNKHLIFTTYQMRFDPRIIKLKQILNNKRNIFSFITWQTYMPKWHEGENFKLSYASRKELGGGAILTLSHEIDLAIYLFGKIKKINVYKLKNDLKINVEDKVIIIFKHQNGSISNLFLNFGSKNTERNIKIFSKKNYYEWDFFKRSLICTKNGKIKKYNFKFDNDEIYNFQLKDFIKKLKYKKLLYSRINFKKTYYTQQVLDKIIKKFNKIKKFY